MDPSAFTSMTSVMLENVSPVRNEYKTLSLEAVKLNHPFFLKPVPSLLVKTNMYLAARSVVETVNSSEDLSG